MLLLSHIISLIVKKFTPVDGNNAASKAIKEPSVKPSKHPRRWR